MKRSLILAAAALAVFFVSCKNATTGLPVPKDATMVFHINTSSLTSKLKWEDIRATQWFKEASKDAEDSLEKKILENPDASGVDTKSDFIVFMQKKGKNSYLVFEGNLKDASAFEVLLKKKNDNKQIIKDGDFNFMKEGSSGVVAWTKSKFIVLNETGFRTNSYYNSMYGGESTSFDSLKLAVKNIFNLSGKDNLESDGRFTSLLGEPGDFHFWMNYENYMEDISSMVDDNPFMSVLQGMNKLFKGNISTGTLNFDDGKITVKSKQYVGEEMKKIMEKYELKPVTEDLVNRIPSQNAVAVMAANYPPGVTKEFLQVAGLDGIANAFLKKYGYSVDELVQGINGQMILAVTDFSVTKVNKTIPGTTYSYSASQPNVDVLFGLSVKNKAAFDKLIGIAESQLDSTDKLVVQSKMHYRTTNDWFAIGTTNETVEKFLNGGTAKIPFADKITGHPVGMYVDIQKLIKGIQSMAPGNSGELSAATSMWQDFVMTGGDYKNGVSTSEMTINFVDKSTNSLKQLNQFVEQLYSSQKKHRDEVFKDYPRVQVDSAILPPAEILPKEQ